MRKHMALAALLIMSCLLMSSCSLIRRCTELDGDLKGAVGLSGDKEGEYTATYQGTKYYQENLYLGVGLEPDRVLLGWNGWRFGYVDEYYSDTTENPLFLYESRLRNFFLREDYDYHEDTFFIDGTDISFRFSDAFEDVNLYAKRKGTKLLLRSETNSHISLELNIITDDGRWYAVTALEGFIMTMSDEFIAALKDNGIVFESDDSTTDSVL